jgi:putative tricarboxylic transport membrane protein
VKLDDAVWGALFALLGCVLLVHVQSFPAMPGQHVGPSLFPGLLGAGLIGCGLVLGVLGLRARAGAGADRPTWASLDAWMRAPRAVAGFAVLVATNLLYLLAVDRLGFVLTGFVYLAALMLVLGVPARRALPLALLLTLAIHGAFYKLLRVPLPWGVLQPIAW